MATYLVGGAIRDLLLHKMPTDLDYAFSEAPKLFLAKHPRAKKIGQRYEIFIYKGHEYAPLFGQDIHEDLANRDLTINAMALDDQGKLYLHPKALSDLQNKILRATSEQAFQKDPLRIFRLARFCAHLPDWQVAPETLELLQNFPQNLLANLASERVGHEVLKALQSKNPERFFTFLAENQLLKPWFWEFQEAQDIPAGPIAWHSGSVFAHTMRVLHEVAGNPLSCWMAICHDLGKIKTPKDILPHHYGHEKRGIDLALDLTKRLMLPTSYLKAATLAVSQHMRAGIYATLRIGSRRDLLWEVHRSGFGEPFWRMVNADSKKDIQSQALKDLALIVKIHLPPRFQNLGLKSQEKLRMMQCQALVNGKHKIE